MSRKFNMEENRYLKYIYHEDLYLIDEPEIKSTEDLGKKAETIDREPKDVPAAEPPPVTYFGNNEKGLLILVCDPTNDLLRPSELDLLMKIVERGLRFSRNDFALVNAFRFPVEQICEEIEFQFLISFGAPLPPIYDNQTRYSCHTSGEKKYLLSEELSVLADDDSKKRLLWKALKSMFNI
ncbi:MAG: hypothetical protein MI975_26495 [Cytophagales bacterium]|nr:hypothetical protein [Cytophagales bacterium]